MYQCLKKNQFEDQDDYQLVAIRREDIEAIRLWRNSQIEILRQKVEISSEEQETYFRKNIWPSFQYPYPQQVLFSFLLQGKCIGYGGLVYIDWEALRAEVSFLVDSYRAQDSFIYARDYSHFLHLLCQAAFADLRLHRLFAETFAFRTDHIKILENFGFEREGTLREHIFKCNRWHDSLLHGLLAVEAGYGK